jgi:hypothetical protein
VRWGSILYPSERRDDYSKTATDFPGGNPEYIPDCLQLGHFAFGHGCLYTSAVMLLVLNISESGVVGAVQANSRKNP